MDRHEPKRLARLGHSPFGRPKLSALGPWTAVRSQTDRVHCFCDDVLVDVLCFPQDIEALELWPCSPATRGETISCWLAACSQGRRVWIRRLEAETACGPEGVAATKRPADEPPADGSPGAKAPRAAEDAEMPDASASRGATSAPSEGRNPGSKERGRGTVTAQMLPVQVSQDEEGVRPVLRTVGVEEAALAPGGGRVSSTLIAQAIWRSSQCPEELSRTWTSAGAASGGEARREGGALGGAVDRAEPNGGSESDPQGLQPRASCLKTGGCVQGTACPAAALRGAMSHPLEVTCALVVEQKGAESRGGGPFRAVLGPELYEAVLSVSSCDGLPPSYVLVGDAAGEVWAIGAPGTPLGPPGVLVANLNQPVAAVLATRLSAPPAAQGVEAEASDAVILVGQAGRAVILAAEPQLQEAQVSARGRAPVLAMRDWRLQQGITSAVACGSRLIYAASGCLYSAEMVADPQPRGGEGNSAIVSQLRPEEELLCCCESPQLIAIARGAGEAASGVLRLLCASGALLEVELRTMASTGATSGSGWPRGAQATSSLPSLREEVQTLLYNAGSASTIIDPLQARIRQAQQQLASLSSSLQLLRATADGKGISLLLRPLRLLTLPGCSISGSGGHQKAFVEVHVEILNNSAHEMVPSWRLILACPSSPRAEHHISPASGCMVELPLGGLGPGQLTEATATLPISWRGSAIIRSYLCIAPPGQHISAKATQPSVRAKQLSGSSGNAACFLLAEERLDVLHLMRPSARKALAMRNSLSGLELDTLKLEVLVRETKAPDGGQWEGKKVLERTLGLEPVAETCAIGKAGVSHWDGMQGETTLGLGRSSRLSLQANPLPIRVGTGAWEVAVASDSLQGLLQGHSAVLRRIILGHKADRSFNPGASAGTDAEAERAARELEYLGVVERQLTMLRDSSEALNQLRKHTCCDKYTSLLPVLQDRGAVLRQAIAYTFFKLRRSYSLGTLFLGTQGCC